MRRIVRMTSVMTDSGNLRHAFYASFSVIRFQFSVFFKVSKSKFPDNFRMPLFHLLHANNEVEHDKGEDTEECHHDGVFTFLDSRDGSEVVDRLRIEGDVGDGSPEERPERRLPDRFALPRDEAPRIRD